VAPSGGSGGDGGNVIFTVDPSFNTLLGFRGRSNFKAEHGAEGALRFLICDGSSVRCLNDAVRSLMIKSKEKLLSSIDMMERC
jgi:GTP1/OBG